MKLSFLIVNTKISKANMKRYGERGSPCLTLLLREKGPEVKPLFITQLEALLYKTRTHLMKEGPKLNACKTLKRKLKLRESKAFSKSMATKIPDISLFIVCSIASSVVLMASKIVLPLTKVL